MCKTLEILVLPILTIATSLFVNGSTAKADELVVLTEDNAANLGIDFQKAKSQLADAGIQVQDNVIGIKFHEESNQVDLSSLDALSVVVDFARIENVPPNGARPGTF